LAALVAIPAVVYVAALLVNRHDRPPSPDALRLAAAYDERPEVALEDNAFVYLLGFGAPLDADPVAIGRQRFAQLQADALPAALPPPPDFMGVDTDVARFRTLCDDVPPECLRADADARAVFEKWSRTHAWLLERYRALLALPQWREVVPSNLPAQLPSYAGVMHGQRLMLLQAKVLADSGDATGVHDLLASDVRFWRTVLASSDLLITKMIAVAALQRHFKWGNLALRGLPERGLASTPAGWLRPLSATELSLHRTLAGEWRFVSGSLLNLQSTSGRSVSDGLLAPLFQPQDTLNRYSTYFTELDAILDAPLAGYPEVADAASELAERAANDALPPASLYNVMGVLLLGAAGPANYSDYARRVADLEGIRRAALATVTLRAAATPSSAMVAALTASSLRNPYDDQPLRWDASDQAVVFVGLSPGGRREQRFYY
jgi:hypothetical protein